MNFILLLVLMMPHDHYLGHGYWWNFREGVHRRVKPCVNSHHSHCHVGTR